MENLAELLYENAERFKNRVAVKLDKRRLTYQQLNQLTNQVAHGLQGMSAGPGKRIGILLNNSVEFIAAYFGILKAGAVVVPLNNFLKGVELEYILQDSAVNLLFSESAYQETLGEIKNKIPELEVIYKEDSPGAFCWSELFSKQPVTNPDASIDPTAVATILYTSGTTGHPKGAMLSHRNLLENARSSQETVQVTPSDRFLLFLPMFHSFTYTVTVILPLLCGSRIVILTSVRPFKRVIKTLLFDRITVFVAVPAIYAPLCEAKLPWYVLPLLRVRCFVSGGSALPVSVWERFERRFKSPLLEGYGLTEAGPVVTFNSVTEERKGGSIGRPLVRVEVRIVDESGKEAPIGVPGELIVRGPSVMLGYLNQAEATAATLKDGWLFTGDVARRDEDGLFYIVDRKKDMIIFRGLNVYPREIEDVLHRHTTVKEAAVIGLPDMDKGEVPKAFVVLEEGESVSIAELKKHCQQNLADYKIPHHFEFRDVLPKTTTGKTLKRQLLEEEKARLGNSEPA